MSAHPSDTTAPPPADHGEGAPADHRLSTELMEFVESLNGQDVTLGELVDMIGDRGLGLLLLILALPAALPLPAPGYATPFGLIIGSLAIRMMMGRTTPWVPKRFRDKTMSHKLLSFSVRNGRLPLRVVELLVRPRLSSLARHRGFLALVAVIILLMACSMILPVPLTNTAPSFVIFILAAGIIEEDGLLLAAGLLLAPVAALISGLAIYTAMTVGLDAVDETVKPMVKGWLGLG